MYPAITQILAPDIIHNQVPSRPIELKGVSGTPSEPGRTDDVFALTNSKALPSMVLLYIDLILKNARCGIFYKLGILILFLVPIPVRRRGGAGGRDGMNVPIITEMRTANKVPS